MKKLKITLTLVLFTYLIFPVSSFSDYKYIVLNNTFAEKNSDESYIKADVVKGLIEDFIMSKEYLSEWTEGTIILKHELYDIDDSLLGYYFEVTKEEKTVGHFITAATFDREPILEYGEGEINRFTEEEKKGNKIYYLGGLDYKYAKDEKDLKQKEEKLKKNTLSKLIKKGKKDSEIYKKVQNHKLKSIKKNKEHKNLWKTYLQQDTFSLSFFSPSVASAASTYKVLPVDDIEQDRAGINNPGSACAAAVGAMIIDYYHDVKTYNVRDNAYYGSWAKLVNHLYSEMNTNFYGTSISEYAHGMHDHVIHDVHASSWGYNYMSATGYEYSYTQRIESDDPVALRFDRFKSDSSVYTEYHFVTGIGFDKNGSYSGDLHVAVKDPDDNSSGTKWIDWTVNDQDMQISYLY